MVAVHRTQASYATLVIVKFRSVPDLDVALSQEMAVEAKK